MVYIVSSYIKLNELISWGVKLVRLWINIFLQFIFIEVLMGTELLHQSLPGIHLLLKLFL